MDNVAKSDFYFIIDNGHGYNTPGKCSPDKSILEWQYTREIAREVVKRLKEQGYNAILLVPEEYDVKLDSTEVLFYDEHMGDIPWTGKKTMRHRVGRVNDICKEYTANHCVLCSIHLNAAGCGEWMEAKGWSVFISANKSGAPSKRSIMCANTFTNTATEMGLKVRVPDPKQKYWIKSLAMTRATLCPAVLTENFFMDNKEDCAWLKTDEAKETIINLHVNALITYYTRRYAKS